MTPTKSSQIEEKSILTECETEVTGGEMLGGSPLIEFEEAGLQ
jgi:hypothetical protein